MSGPVAPFVPPPLSQRARWRLLLLILSGPLFVAILTAALGRHPGMPRNLHELIRFFGLQTLLWSTVFVVGFRISKATAAQLRLVTKNPLRTIAFGLFWFVAIRIFINLFYGMLSQWINPTTFWDMEEKLATFNDARNITHHFKITIAAFGLASLQAGLTEELWRAGMLAGIKALFPSVKSFPLILVVAILFSLGHLYQGWWGVANGLLAGILLGSVLVYRNSYWEAAIAHVLFDAVTFGVAFLAMLNLHELDPWIVDDAAKGNIRRVQHWVALGGNVNATFDAGKDWKNITALENAAGHANPEMVRVLLDEGADPNLADSHGRTPLIAAAEQNHLPNLALLLAHGVQIDAQDNRGFTALRTAAEYNHIEAARLLLAHGANPNIRDHAGLSPLDAARKEDFADLKKLLQEKSP